jgi:hypothetical protein
MFGRAVVVGVLVWLLFFQLGHLGLDADGLHWHVDGRWRGVCQQLLTHCDYVLRLRSQ